MFIIVARQQNSNENKTSVLINTSIKIVSSNKHIGRWLTERAEQKKEIKDSIEVTHIAIIKMKKFLCNHDIKLNLRTRIMRCFVFTTLSYKIVALRTKVENLKKIDTFEIGCCRRMLRISWVDRITD